MQTMNLSNAATLACAGDAPTPEQLDEWQAYLADQRSKYPSLY